MEESKTIETAKSLQEDFKLSDFQALQIAVQIRRNELYASAHVITNLGPTALEAIAIQMGMAAGGRGGVSLIDAISDLGDSIASAILEHKPE